MAGTTFFIGTRRANGQIGSISNGLGLTNFIELFKDKGDRRVLIDYSPVIEKLHELHKATNEENIRNKYNSMFNYWVDAKTYDTGQIKILKSETLAHQANSLINELQLKLQKSKIEGVLTYNLPLNDSSGYYQKMESFRADAEIYIDSLLIYIHSKASLEIGSFKKDTVLSQYGMFLENLIRDMYNSLLGRGYYGLSDSFLKYLAFERPADLPEYLALDGKDESSDSFLLRILKNEKPYESYREGLGYRQEISIKYDNFWPKVICVIDFLKSLLYKISLINELLAALRAGNVEWDEDCNSVDELRSRLQFSQ